MSSLGMTPDWPVYEDASDPTQYALVPVHKPSPDSQLIGLETTAATLDPQIERHHLNKGHWRGVRRGAEAMWVGSDVSAWSTNETFEFLYAGLEHHRHYEVC